MSHTKTPWEVYQPRKYVSIRAADGTYIIEGLSRGLPSLANAAHIVRCVNSHDALVEALEDLVALLPDPELDTDDIQKEYVLKAQATLAASHQETP